MRKKTSIISLITLIVFSFYITLLPVHAEAPEPPETASPYIYMMNADTGEVLYNKDGETTIYPASMTKIMTAVLAVENLDDLQETYTITEDVFTDLYGIDATMAGFALYDSPTIEDLLYGLLLPSGADAANALALAVAGSIPDFVEMMNEKCAELGMDDTHFNNPTGLHEEDHYSTCHDIAVLLQYARKSETLCTVLDAREYVTTPLVSQPQGITMTKAIVQEVYDEVPGFEGSKSGYTPDAGRCLASSAYVNDLHLILVTGGAADYYGPQNDAILMYQWAGEAYCTQTVVRSGQFLAEINFIDAVESTPITLTTEDDIERMLPSDTVLTETAEFVETLTAPQSVGTELGTYRVMNGDEVLYEKTYYLDREIEQTTKAKIRDFVQKNLVSIIFYGTAALLVIILIPLCLSSRKRRKKKSRRR